MKCKNCQKINEIDGFGGYLHYSSTKEFMDDNVASGHLKIIAITQFEILYQCEKCQTKWALAEPDYPVTGYLEHR